MMSSRYAGSSRHRSRQSSTDSEELVDQVKQIVATLDEVVSSRPHQWETYLASARSAVAALERLSFFRDPGRFVEQVWIIRGLQDYAYHDADTGCISDIADFCQASWLRVLRNHPENVDILTGRLKPLYSALLWLTVLMHNPFQDSGTTGCREHSTPLQEYTMRRGMTVRAEAVANLVSQCIYCASRRF